MLCADDKVDFKEYTVHDVAGLTKLYFRELQEPLFTFDLYVSSLMLIFF
jgi:hypothetical protein